jgi:hypothetical protein
MKNLRLFPFVPFVACLLFLAKQSDASDLKKLSGIYEYVYENNATLIENHYIELDASKALPTGTYYGTSDDFDDSREGYLPGFFMAPMSDLELTDSVIRFKVTVRKGSMWSKPITPFSKDKRGKEWTVNLGSNERIYTGKISGNKITLENVGVGPRVFIKRPGK